MAGCGWVAIQVPGDIGAPGDPDMVMRHDMVKKTDKASEAGRAANQPAMQVDRHHFWGGFPPHTAHQTPSVR